VSDLTRCPRCSVWYRIAPETLQQAQGLVRCGRCGEVFDARATLWSGEATPAAEETGGRDPEPLAPRPAEPPRNAPPDKDDSPPLGRFEDLDLDLEAMLEATPSADTAVAPPIAEDPFAVVDEPFTVPATDPIAPAPHRRPAVARGPRPLWLLGDGALALLLVVSLVVLHPWRDAGSAGTTARPGAKPTPAVASDPKAFRVTAAEVVPSRRHPRTALVVAGTILNATPRPEALPWLLVRLTGVTGRTVATGVFAPKRYAPHGRSVLHGRTAVPFRLRVLAPTRPAAGFRIELCRGRPPRLFCR
jgi:predicted Zn finger-like uncharacterized protein